MNDEKSEKAGLTISVKIPHEKIGLPSRPMHVWIAFAIFAVLLIGLGAVLGVKFCNWAEIFLMREPLTLKILHYHPMLVLMLCLGFAFILLLLYFIYCRFVLGVARENRKAEKDRMDFISQQVDMLKSLGVAPVKRQRTETINVVITHLGQGGNDGAETVEKDPKKPNGDGDDGSLAYRVDVSNDLSSVATDGK